MIKPSIPTDPIPPKLNDQLGPTLVITAKEVKYYALACDAWEGGEYTDVEMAETYPGLSQSNACDWAIYGLTVQGNLNLENIFILQATYAEQMRAHVKLLRDIIENMYKLSGKVQDEALKPITEIKTLE